MSYWINQPIQLINNNESIGYIIDNLDNQQNLILPKDFQLKTLNQSYLEEVHSLLKEHYIEDAKHIVRLIYSKDFLYWYLKLVPPGLMIGLVYKNKLVGLITAIFLDMIIYGNKLKIPYVNLLCIQKKIRKLGLAIFLIDEIKKRIHQKEINCALFTGMNIPTKSFCTLKNFAIPINYPKLKEVGFLEKDFISIPKIEENPLHLVKISDLESIIPKLNKFMDKFSIRPFFMPDTGHHFLFPKKNIIYSFVKRNNHGEVTDFINIYKNYYYFIEKHQIISIGLIAFYFYETMTLTELITFLIDKLSNYKIDQLSFYSMADNNDINITRFLTEAQLNYFFYNFKMKQTDEHQLCFFPI